MPRTASHRRCIVARIVVAALILTSVGVPPGLSSQGVADPSATAPYGVDVPPLFADEAPLELRIEADFREIRGDRRSENPEHDGFVHVLEADGSESVWPVKVRTRGNFRLQSRICAFPPLRLNFPRSRVEGGVFEGQDKIKLVTHCRDRYEDELLREYVAYRIYNQITESSFRVRLARITYVDTSGRDEPLQRMAFFIEMEEALAERLGGRIMEDEELRDGVHPARITGPDALRVDLFAYMVGNTDYTMYFPSPNGGLHNVAAVEHESGGVTPVPYDFDWTGLVDALYAEPNPRLGVRSVTDRVFRGFCRPGLDYGAAYADFTGARAAIDGLVRDFEAMSEDERRSVGRYLDEFWTTLESESRAGERIAGACRSYG